jgi:hypothetical protein
VANLHGVKKKAGLGHRPPLFFRPLSFLQAEKSFGIPFI